MPEITQKCGSIRVLLNNRLRRILSIHIFLLTVMNLAKNQFHFLLLYVHEVIDDYHTKESHQKTI